MRHFHSATRVAYWALISMVLAGAGFAQSLSITNYKVFDDTPTTGTWWSYTYGADLLNSGPALSSATATLTTSVPNIQVVSGQNVLKFGAVATNGQVTSKNQFTILIDRTVQFKFTDLHWTFTSVQAPPPPVANAGANQSAVVGTTVTLDGSKSTNPSGIGTLSYSWSFVTLPSGSTTSLVNPNSVNPTFFMDVPGPFVIQLTVSNGTASGSATTTVSTDTPPIANAGPNQSVAPGAHIILDGSKSTDPDGDPITYSWSFTTIPSGSTAVLNGANTVSPTFTADLPGKYIIQLIVNDGKQNSTPSSVTISENSPPVANAGPNQSAITTGTLVHLDGSKSTDVDGDPLTYKWSLITLPPNSLSVLSSTTSVTTTFIPDLTGTYVAQLIVNDGMSDSTPSTVTISTIPAIQKPVANAGPNQRVIPNSVVNLDGSGSSDPQSLPLVYSWSILVKPSGSAVTLSNPNAIKPSFTPDIIGSYVVQLVVFDGTLASDPSTVLIAIDIPPVANAGLNQNVKLGSTVQLDGSGSIDPNGNGITYSWSFTNRPAGSTAVLSSTTAIKPTFVADVAGTYVVQLIVSDALQSSNPPSTVMVTVVKKPTANAGPPQKVVPGTTVTLDASGSSDPQSLPLTYSWSFTGKPSGSAAVLSDNTAVNPTFTGDLPGKYTLQLTVSNGPWISDPSTVTIVVDAAPVANAGSNQNVILGANVVLNGSASSDPDGDPITYSWSFTSLPPGSAAALSGANTVAPTFTADVAGTYVLQLVVNDGMLNSNVASVSIVAALPKIITLTPNPLVIATSSSGTMTVTLAAPAGPGGQVVTLTNGTPSVATVPASVTVPPSATVITFGVTAVAKGSTTITASAPGFPNSSAVVNVVSPSATITFDLPQVGLGGQVTGHVTLNVPSISGTNAGISASPSGIVSVPTSVPIPAGGTTASFPISGLKLATATVRGSVPGYASVTALITVVTEPLINVPSTLIAQATQPPVMLNISLQNPAPNGGLTVTLTSADPTKASVTPSVFFNAGATTPTSQPMVTGVGVGTVTINASASGYASGGTAVTVTAGPPVSITVGGTPQSTAINSAFAPLTALVHDAYGNPVSGVAVTFAAPKTGPSVTVASITATSNSSGVASASLVANGTPGGPYIVTATAAGLVGNYSLMNLSAPPKSILATSGGGQSAPILTQFALPLQAIVKDPGGNPMPGVVVVFSAPTAAGASGNFGASTTASVITDATGTATSPPVIANGTVSAAGKPYTVKVSIASNANLSATYSMTNLAGPPSQIAPTAGSGQSATIGKTFAVLLQATVKDAGGNLASGVPVIFTAPASGPGGTFTGGFSTVTITTNTSGVATAPQFIANTTSGTYTVTATFSGGPTASFSLTNNSGPAASITATGGTPQNGQINAAYTPLQATVRDAGGNPVKGVTVIFTAPGSTSVPSGKFGSSATNSATTDVNGVATSAALTANLVLGSFTVNATVSGVSTPAGFFLTNTPGAPTSITAVAGTPQTLQAGLAPTTPLKALVKDIGGNLLNNQTVTFAVVAGANGQGGTFTGGTTSATATTDATGTVVAPGYTANGKVGSYTVTATINSLTTSFALTNKAGPPASIAPAPGTSGQTAHLTVPFTTPLAAMVTDAAGNPVSGVVVTFTAPNQGPSGTFAGNALSATATSDATGKATAAAFTPNMVLGGYTVSASAVNGTLTTSFSLTNAVGPAKTITATSGSGQSTQIAQPYANPLVATVQDAGGNLVPGVSVTFTAPKQGSSVTFAGGSNIATVTTDNNGVATSPLMTANGTVSSPTLTVVAASNGVSANFTLTNTAGPPAHMIASAGTPQTAAEGEQFATKLAVTVTDAGGNPASGAVVTFTAPGSGPSGLFGANTSTTVTTNTSGIATVPLFVANMTAGTYNVTATLSALTPVNFVLTNAVCVPIAPATACPSISMGNLSVGQNLLATETVTLSTAAGGSGVNVIVSSSDPTKVLLSGRLDDPGTPTLAVPIASGVTSTGIFVHSLVSSGSAFITASAPGYVFGVANITLTPSGFVLSIPSQPSSNNLVMPNGGTANLVLQSYQLDSSLNPIGFQDLRGGFSVNVTINDSNSKVGTISLTSPVTLTGDTNPMNFTFTGDPTNTGSTAITVVAPTGFSTPASGSTVNVNVSAAQLAVVQADATIGENLQTSATIQFAGGGTQPSDTLFTVTSSDPTKLLFSLSPTAAGTASISVKIPAGFTKSAAFSIQALTNTGSVPYTVQATGFPMLTKSATLAPSGIVVSGPAGLGNAFPTTTQSAASTITVMTEVLNSSNKPVSQQSVAGGMTVSVIVSSSNTSVGTITVSPLTIGGNQNSATTQFQPVSTNSTAATVVISANVPTGMSAPSLDGSVSAVVNEPGMSLSANNSTIGQDLQIQDSVILGAPAPPGGLQVTITSNSANLMVAQNPTDAGTSSITFTIPAGQTSGSYYLQAFANSGTATYTATAPSFNSKTATITLGNSGVALAGPLGINSSLYSTTVASGTSTWTVYTALLDGSNNYVGAQSLRAGVTVTANLSSSNTNVGTIVSPVTINGGGANNVTTTFTPLTTGSTSVTLAQPVNLGLAANNKAVAVTVH